MRDRPRPGRQPRVERDEVRGSRNGLSLARAGGGRGGAFAGSNAQRILQEEVCD